MKQSLPEISLEGVMGWLRENLLLVLTFSGDLMLILFGVVFIYMFFLRLLLLSFYEASCDVGYFCWYCCCCLVLFICVFCCCLLLLLLLLIILLLL